MRLLICQLRHDSDVLYYYWVTGSTDLLVTFHLAFLENMSIKTKVVIIFIDSPGLLIFHTNQQLILFNVIFHLQSEIKTVHSS